MRQFFILSIAMVVFAYAQVSTAAIIPVVGDGADRQVKADGSMPWVGQPEIRVGVGDTQASVAVYVFELPVLPAGESVVDATFEFTVVGHNNWGSLDDKTADLYGLPMRSASAAQGTDFFVGTFGTDAGATALQESIISGSFRSDDQNGFIGATTLITDATGSSNLAAYLNAQYASASYDAAGTNYVFLRVNATSDWAGTTYRYWSVATANNSTEENRPLLTITSDVPEPASLGLLTLAGLVLIRRR